jgi:hypothetical protein
MLSTDLYGEVRPEFLRLLGSPAAPLYLDAADALEREAALRPAAVSREEALALLERVAERHGEISLEEEAPGASARERSRVVLGRLCAAGWLSVQDRSDYQSFVLIEPAAAVMLEALRKIARPGAVVFSDKLVKTCHALNNTEALRTEPWQTVSECIEDVRHGEQELRAVAKSVERHTRRQLAAKSLKENLAVVFDEFAGNVGSGAYAELVRARLPTRLPEARDAVERLQNDTDLLHKMAEELSRREGCEHATAVARVRNRLHDLALALDRIVPSADEVDQRTADFTRKSLARFRYLQEVTGEHRATVQAFFEKLNAHFGGRRVADAEAEIKELPPLLLTDIKIPAGLESLYSPRLRRALGEIEPLDDDVGDDVLDRTQRQLAATLRDSMTVARANRFAAEAFEKHGAHVPSAKLVRTDDDLADLIACLLHASARDAKYRVDLPRELDDPASDQRHEDVVLAGTRRLERFTLVKK